jgi:hypothetical protein
MQVYQVFDATTGKTARYFGDRASAQKWAKAQPANRNILFIRLVEVPTDKPAVIGYLNAEEPSLMPLKLWKLSKRGGLTEIDVTFTPTAETDDDYFKPAEGDAPELSDEEAEEIEPACLSLSEGETAPVVATLYSCADCGCRQAATDKCRECGSTKVRPLPALFFEVTPESDE